MNCPECGAGPFILSPGEAPPEPTPADVEIARIHASSAERMALIDRGIDPDRREPLTGAETALEVAEVVADASVEIAAEEASAEVAAAEAVGDAMVAAAEVVGDALEVAAEVVTADDSGELPDEIIVTDTTEDGEEASASGSHASRWGFH
jgi:hypothetical protein